ncbi:MAG: hypothetical protein QM696_11340 [Steroidobacteraceae bacterium]
MFSAKRTAVDNAGLKSPTFDAASGVSGVVSASDGSARLLGAADKIYNDVMRVPAGIAHVGGVAASAYQAFGGSNEVERAQGRQDLVMAGATRIPVVGPLMTHSYGVGRLLGEILGSQEDNG